MEGTNSDTERKSNIVYEHVERRFEISFTEKRRQWTKVGLMIWLESLPATRALSALHKPARGDKDTSRTH